ncbi:MAG: hypothetical protein AAGA60_31875 [Cyanobacteria bacterium P01_E01_bin.42]
MLDITRSWINSIQFTPPRGSLEKVDCLLEEAIQTYLFEPEPKIKPRDRQTAVRVAISHVRQVLESKFEKNLVKDFLKTKYSLKGQLNQNTFDVAVANGKPILAAQGISFEVRTKEADLGNLAWKIADTKKAIPELPLAVITLPPRANTPHLQELQKLYEIHSHTYQKLGAEIVTEERADSWIAKQLTSVKVN